jgi:hypothetical protein
MEYLCISGYTEFIQLRIHNSRPKNLIYKVMKLE